MKYKLITASSLILASALVVPVIAQTIGASKIVALPGSITTVSSSRPMVLVVSASGNVLMRGVVSSVGTSSLMVNSWGGPWKVKVSSSTKVTPTTATSSLSKIKIGDFVGVMGSISDKTPTINADLVRDWTAKPL